MVSHSFLPFPAKIVAIANGMVYGPVWGTVITWVGAMLGASTAFGLVRLLGRPFVRRVLSSRHHQQLALWSQEHGALALLIGRLIPVIAFNLINCSFLASQTCARLDAAESFTHCSRGPRPLYSSGPARPGGNG